MADGGDSDSVCSQSSRCTGYVLATSSISQEEACDLIIFYHHNSNMKEPVLTAIAKLKEQQLIVRTSVDATLAAGKLIQEQYHAVTLSSRFRVFVMNTSFLKHDLPQCQIIMSDGNVCSKENTLLLCRRTHKKKIPENLQLLPIEFLSTKPDGSEIADHIFRFIENNRKVKAIGVGPSESSLTKELHAKREEYLEKNKVMFLDTMERFDNRRLYVLCVCVKPISSDTSIYDALSLVPWPKVFDFDVDTDGSGLLSILRKKLPKGRLGYLTQQQRASDIRQRDVNWTAMIKDGKGDGQLHSHISSLAKFCSGRKPATMLILWYVDEIQTDLEEDLRDFISQIRFSFGGRPIKIVLCIPKLPEDGSEMSTICKRVVDDRIVAPLKNVCDWIYSLKDELDTSDLDILATGLPKLKTGDEDTFELDLEKWVWITSDIHVLTIPSVQLPKTSETQSEKVNILGVEFLKGGELTWDVLKNGSFDAQRDKFEEIRAYLLSLIEGEHSTIVTLHHAPGSGGTTLGRQILWSLRGEVPCLALEKRSEIKDDFLEKIIFIQQNSNRPALLLIDGRSHEEVRKILDMCRNERVIILHVLRHYDIAHDVISEQGGRFTLPDKLSETEALKFKEILLKYGTAGIKKTMKNLTQDIVDRKCDHSVFEYGITAFNADFTGIGKYVKSHLRMPENCWERGGKVPEKWHRVAAMLAFANYYGNRSLPAEFFANILEKPVLETVNIRKDIPELGQQLIRECSEGDEWKISHFLVAKEILEQYLGGSASESNKPQLSDTARKRLKILACEFLRCMKEHQGTWNALHDDLVTIVMDIFIKRDKDDSEDDGGVRRKSWYARAITDISNEQEQTDVFSDLVDKFPTNAEFHAHFGRFLAKTRRHEKAEKVLHDALAVRNEYLQDKGVPESARGDDEVLQRIHNMFGYACFDNLRHKFGHMATALIGERSTCDIPGMRKAHSIAQSAIGHFRDCRHCYYPSVNQSYACIGELKVRLSMTEFCKKHVNYNVPTLSPPNHPLNFIWQFIVDSFAECEHLLSHSSATSGDTATSQREIHILFQRYMKCYCTKPQHLENLMAKIDQSSLAFLRCRVTYLKFTCGNVAAKRKFEIYQDLPRHKLGEYAALLESIISDPRSAEIRMSPYMEDWIKVARHLREPVSLETAKSYVDKWDRRNEKESLSSFYKYVLQFILTLLRLTPERDLLNECEQRLMECQRYLKQNIVQIPIESLKKIPKRSDYTLSMLQNSRDPTDGQLHEFVGQVTAVKENSGHIEIRGTGLEVFFTPKKYKLWSYHAKSQQRVRFTLGFNPRNGAQAYNVVEMSIRYTCPVCTHQDEYPDSQYVKCTACDELFKTSTEQA